MTEGTRPRAIPWPRAILEPLVVVAGLTALSVLLQPGRPSSVGGIAVAVMVMFLRWGRSYGPLVGEAVAIGVIVLFVALLGADGRWPAGRAADWLYWVSHAAAIWLGCFAYAAATHLGDR